MNAGINRLRVELGRKPRPVPKVQDVYCKRSFVTGIKDKVRTQRDFSDSASLIVKRKPLRHRCELQSLREELFANADRGLTIVPGNEFNDFPEVLNRRVCDQDFEAHREIIGLTSSIGRTRPAATSFRPRVSAASSAASSGVVSEANNSAVKSARSCGFKDAIAVLISSTVLIRVHFNPSLQAAQSAFRSRALAITRS
jgi:hypothetical protein